MEHSRAEVPLVTFKRSARNRVLFSSWRSDGGMSLFFILVVTILLFASCASSRKSSSGTDFRELARAGIRLGFDIEEHDDHRLFVESSRWIGVPYRAGGTNKRGVDCSGLTCAIYSNVYGKKLHRKSVDQKEKDCKRVSKKELRSGDLLFFSTANTGKKVGHTGIYLKNNKFIHASSSRGVVVSDLNENYYQKHWISGGRAK